MSSENMHTEQVKGGNNGNNSKIISKSSMVNCSTCTRTASEAKGTLAISMQFQCPPQSLDIWLHTCELHCTKWVALLHKSGLRSTLKPMHTLSRQKAFWSTFHNPNYCEGHALIFRPNLKGFICAVSYEPLPRKKRGGGLLFWSRIHDQWPLFTGIQFKSSKLNKNAGQHILLLETGLKIFRYLGSTPFVVRMSDKFSRFCC